MRIITTFLFMFISVNGFANSCNEQSFATAEALFDQVQERFDTGLASKVDLVEAKAFYWQQKICLNKVSKKAFCEVGMEFQKESLASIQSAYEVGTRTLSDVVQHTQNVAYWENFCQ